jgi:phosphoglycolate phosphatase-like HAD superfamily hydrolase
MNIGLFDMDGSLADYEGQLRNDIRKLVSESDLKRFDELGMWQADELEPFKSLIRLLKKQPCWWRNLPELRDGIAIFDLAEEIGFKNHILTKGPKHYPRAWKEKVEWCQEHLGEQIDIHITSDKSMVYGKFLYDDFPDYMDRWLKARPRGLGIMPVNDTNRGYTHSRCVKWDGTNYDEVKTALEGCFKRDNCRK